MELGQDDLEHDKKFTNSTESSFMLEIESAPRPPTMSRIGATASHSTEVEEMDPANDPAGAIHTTHPQHAPTHNHSRPRSHARATHISSHHANNDSSLANNKPYVNNSKSSGFVLRYDALPPPAPAPAPAPPAAPANGPSSSREVVLQRLSEALLRRSLAKIDLSQRGLGPSDARLVKMALLNNASLTVLKLGYNSLGDKGVETLVGGIAEHRSLRSLDLGFNNFGDDGCRALAAAMQESAAKAGNCGTIQTLYLAGNLIGEDGAMALADVIRRGSSLRKLYMTGNRLGPDGVKALTEAMIEDEFRRRYSNVNGEVNIDVDMSNADLALNGFPSGSNAMHQSTPYMTGMATASGQTSMTTTTPCKGMLKGNGIQELFLGGTGMDYGGCQAVVRLLEKTACLRVLSLPNCEIGDEQVSMLASSIKANRELIPLESLQLSFNAFSSRGLEYLMNAIWGSRTIKELRIDNNEIGDRGAQQLAAILPYVKTLETLDVGFNQIKATGLKPLMKAVAETHHLLSLSLSGNVVDISSAKAVSYALAYNRSLKSLYLVHCSIGVEGKRHIAAGAVSNSRTKLREIIGFKLGTVIITLGFPPALEHWTNEQVLNFVHLMWDKSQFNSENAEEEEVLDPLNFLPGSSDGGQHNKTLSGPLEASIVVDVAKRAFESLVENGVDVFSRQPGHPREPSFDSPIARDTVIMESLDGSSAEGESSPWGSTVVEPVSTKQAKSFVAPPETFPPRKNNNSDPSRKKRIVEWLCSNIQHLNRLAQIPFNPTELWKLHHHYFTPVVNESGGSVQYASSVPEVSRGSSTNDPVNSSMEGSRDKLSVPVSDPSIPASPADVSSLPMLKRKVSYRFLGEAVMASQQSNATPRHHGTNTNMNAVSKMLEDGLSGHGLQPKNKRARRNRTRISFLPKVKRKLDSYLDVCHEKALITMRQLYFVEQAILRGSVNPVDQGVMPRTHLSGYLAADAETIVVDMI